MSTLTCRQARRLLAPYHDGELPLDQQAAVQSHLRACAACREERRRLRELGALLRVVGSRAPEEPGRLERHVLARLQAERQTSWHGRLNRLFEDMHLVWAAAGATVATVTVVLAVFGLMRLTLQQQPASMSALIASLSSPTGSDLNPMRVSDQRLLPRFDPDTIVGALLDSEEGVFALAAVVSRDGTVQSVQLLTNGGQAIELDRAEVLQLLDAASQARFLPARSSGGSPVAVSMIWLVAHTTVRGKIADTLPGLQTPHTPASPPLIQDPELPISELPAANPVGSATA
ncbi:MAG TPA: zf-HC2 domain-containing protein [Vicinamibacterales bacterium]